MAFCAFDESAALFDSTPVENMFIAEYMLRAPGDFVKVYIYALMLCYHKSERMSLTTMAKDLGMTEEEVERAFKYWSREGLCRQVGDNPVAYKLYNLKQLTLTRAQSPAEPLYHQDFAEEVKRILRRDELYPAEWRMIYDWIDVYELPEIVVIMLLEYEMKKSRGRVKIAIANETAIEWARSGVTTVEDVEKFEFIEQERVKDLRKLLRHMGYRHEPSEEEKKLYNKWLDEWGFEPEAVTNACGEMTSGKPSMRFLDTILQRYEQLGVRTAKELAKSMDKEHADREFVRSLFAALGRVGAVPTSEDSALMEAWKLDGFAPDFIRLAAEKVHRETHESSIKAIDDYLKRCKALHITTVEAMQENDMRIGMLNDQLLEVYKAAGIEKRPNAPDRKLLGMWLNMMNANLEIILQAAEYAQGSGAPMRLMGKILSDWQRAGIMTLEAAREEHEAHLRTAPQAARRPENKPQDAMLRYTPEQRRETYSAAVLDFDEEDN